jgi:hypothetical protein
MMNAVFYTQVRHRSARGAVAAAALLASVGVVSLGACSAPDASARVDPIGPSVDQFAYVAPVLSRRCGSIDCHGSKFRNMRVYGYGGQRIEAMALPDGGQRMGALPDAPAVVTAQEALATYESVIALEPEIMRDVVKSGGANPERLTFLRKGRGDEQHKGYRRLMPGDASDRCITSWLAGSVDTAACATGGCFTTEKMPFPIITSISSPCL